MWKYLVFFAAFHTLGRLPVAVLYRLMSFAAWVAYYLARGARRNVLDNLRHVMPPGTPAAEVRRAARQVFRTVALYYADVAHLPWTDTGHLLRRRMVLHGLEENLFAAIKKGKGVIMLTAHYGNPELAAQGLVPLKVPVLALTEPLQPPRLSRLMDSFRSSKGHAFAPVSVGSVKRVMKTLKSGGVVALMGDRDIEGPRMLLPFCGVETYMPTGPIEVALRTGATVIPSFSHRRDTRIIEAYMEEPLFLERTGDFEADVRNGALRFLERFEKRLRADPGQWAVLESVWDAGAGEGRGR
jgi:KDO2-lipid IV(A) lauroyltransferase